MKKQPEITEATRKAFIDAFCTFYKDKPVEKITIQEITNEAGYNRSTFYQYFKDTYDLLNYLEDMVISRVLENIVAKVVYGDIGNTLIASFTKVQKEMNIYVEVLLSNINSTKFMERLKTAMLPVFMEQFHISETDTKSVYVLEFYLSGIISMSRRWLQSGQDVPIGEIGRLLHTLFVDGVRTTLEKNIQMRENKHE